jgi:hypothetical protein
MVAPEEIAGTANAFTPPSDNCMTSKQSNYISFHVSCNSRTGENNIVFAEKDYEIISESLRKGLISDGGKNAYSWTIA